MKEQGIYKKLREAAAMANVVEACGSGYVSLDAASVHDMNIMLLETLREVTTIQEDVVKAMKGPVKL